jgi:hypothetical protein
MRNEAKPEKDREMGSRKPGPTQERGKRMSQEDGGGESPQMTSAYPRTRARWE